MSNTTIAGDAVAAKTQELAEAILATPDFAAKLADIEAFLADDEAKGRYTSVMEKRQELLAKQQEGRPVTFEDQDGLEKMQAGLIADDTTRKFLEAQEHLNGIHSSVVTYIGKTMELGRIPTEEELGCCGGEGGGGG